MTEVFESLRKEHGLLERLFFRVENGLKLGKAEARPAIVKDLLVVFPALQKHEEIEAEIAEIAALEGGRDQRPLLRAMEQDHDFLRSLRKDIELLIAHGDEYPFAQTGRLVGRLIGHLREHFAKEEQREWPFLLRTLRPRKGAPLPAALMRRVRALEHEMLRRDARIAEYLSKEAL